MENDQNSLLVRYRREIAGLVILALYLTFTPYTLNHDVGLNLDAGRRLLQGEIPYLDFIDTNPPLTSYLSVLPMVFHGAGLTVQQSFGLFVALLSIYALTLLLLLFSVRNYNERLVRTAFWLLLLFFALSNRTYDFGQREQLFVLLYLPYPLLRWRLFNNNRVSGKLGWLVGIMAGIGCNIKPFFLLFPLLMELYWLLEYRRLKWIFRPEVFGLAGITLGYGFHFFLLPQPAREAFFHRWLPLIRDHYSVYNEPLKNGLQYPEVWIGVASILVLLIASLKYGREWQRRLIPFGIWIFSGLVVFFIQHKYWDYHMIPVQAGFWLVYILGTLLILESFRFGTIGTVSQGIIFSFIAAFVFLFALISRPNDWNRLFFVISLLMAGLIASYMYRANLPLGEKRKTWQFHSWLSLLVPVALLLVSLYPRHPVDVRQTRIGKIILEETVAGDPVLFIDTSLPPGHPTALLLDRWQASRYLVTFPIAFFNQDRVEYNGDRFPYPSREELSGEEEKFISELEEDIARNHPKLLFIRADGKAQACPYGFDILTYLRTLGFGMEVMKAYTPLRRVDQYVVLRRNDGR